MDEIITDIEDHPDYPDLLDEIVKYGNYSKAELIDCLWGESRTKLSLSYLSRGELLALLIDGIHGATCQ